MHEDVTPTRRHVVTAGAAATLGIASTALTGCDGSSGPTAAGVTPPGSAGSGTGGPADSSPTVRPPSAASSSSAASGPLAKLAAVPVGGAIAAKGADGTPIIIAQPQAGTVVAFSGVCTHMGCTVVPAGQKLLCPCHNSTFDVATGAVGGGLAPTALPAVAVKVDGVNVVAG